MLPDGITLDCTTGLMIWAAAFAEAFTATWQRLPKNAQHMLRQTGDGLRVQLVETIPDERCVVWAESHRSGTLRFARRCCEGLPHELLQTLVAHELGHLFRYALGYADWNENEPEADLQCLNWGFDMQRLRLLPAEGGITK
jgi:hypothetical protein